MTPDKFIKKVLSLAGGATAIAATCGTPVKRQNVEYWVRVGEFPAEHCPTLERAYGEACEDLRPDLRWVRIEDPDWPNGKPLLDVATTV